MPDRVLKYLLILPAAFVVTVTTLYPLGFAFMTSFREWRLDRSPVPGKFVGVDNYAYALLEDPEFWNAIRVTTGFVVLDVAITVVLALALAMLLRREGVLHKWTRALLILPFAMSPALIGVSFRFMFNTELGVFHAIAKTVAPFTRDIVWLGDPFWALFALVMSDVWHWAPYMTLVFLGGLASLGVETEEAARIDGASDWQVFRDIVLPQLAPVIAVVAILKTIFALKMFDQIVTLTGGGPGTSTETLAYFVYKAAFKWYDMGYASALAYILTAALFLFAIPYMRFVIKKGGPAA